MSHLLARKQNRFLLYGLGAGMLFLMGAVILWVPVAKGLPAVLLALVYLIFQWHPVRIPVSRFTTLSLSPFDVTLVMLTGYGTSLLVITIQLLAGYAIEPKRIKQLTVRILEKGLLFGLVPVANDWFGMLEAFDAMRILGIVMVFHLGNHCLTFVRMRLLQGVRYPSYSRIWVYPQTLELLYSFFAALFSNQLLHTVSAGNALVLFVALVLLGSMHRMHVIRVKQQIKYSEQKIRDSFIFNSIDYEIIAIDMNRRITVLNQKAHEFLKLEREQVIGKRYEDVFSPLLKARDRRLLHTLEKGISYNLRAYPVTVRGEIFYFDIYTTPMKDDEGRMAGAVGVYLDVTHQKQLEQEMLQKDKLSLIGKMAAGTVHEIRNPLAIAKGHLELAATKINNQAETAMVRHLEIMRAQLDRANNTLNRLLALAKPKETNKVRVDIQELIDDAVEWVHHAATANGIRLTGHEYKDEVHVEVDPEQMKQVLINLLYNAFDATPQGGSVDVWAQVDDDARQVAILVEDTGKGIGQTELEKIGQAFFTTKPSGTGLGLMISTQIVESHNGHLQITSEIGKGTKFAIWLPLPISRH